MKKTTLIFMALILFIFIPLSCLGFAENILTEKPTAEIEKIDIDSISLEGITFLFDIKISNPYPVSIDYMIKIS